MVVAMRIPVDLSKPFSYTHYLIETDTDTSRTLEELVWEDGISAITGTSFSA